MDSQRWIYLAIRDERTCSSPSLAGTFQGLVQCFQIVSRGLIRSRRNEGLVNGIEKEKTDLQADCCS